MTQVHVVLFMSFALGALAGCGTKSSDRQPGVDGAYQADSSNCSSQFVSDYNDVVYKLRGVYTEADLLAAEAKVDDFGTKYKGVACVAKVREIDNPASSATTSTLNADSEVAKWKSAIHSAKEKIQEYHRIPREPVVPTQPTQPSQPAQPEQPAAPSDPTPVLSLPHGFELEITDPNFLKMRQGSEKPLYVQNGQVVSDFLSLSYGKPFCALLKLERSADRAVTQFEFREIMAGAPGDKIDFQAKSHARDGGMICARGGDGGWKLSDLELAFSGLGRIRVLGPLADSMTLETL